MSCRFASRLADSGHQHLLLDLTAVPLIDIRGVEAIAQARRAANQHGSRLTIRYRSRQVGRLLEVTRMVGYLTSDLVLERD